MRVSMTIESDGVVTEVSREYQPEFVESQTYEGGVILGGERPYLGIATQAVARAALLAHRIHIETE